MKIIKKIEEEEKIKYVFDNNISVVQPNIKIVYGKDVLYPLEYLPPVSQIIKKYIEDQFTISKVNDNKIY